MLVALVFASAAPVLAQVRGDPRVYESGLPISGGAISGAVSTCTGDQVSYDNNGVAGCQLATDAAPQGILLRPQTAYPAGTQTAATLVLAGGQDETKCAIDGADPSVSCAGDNDTITVAVVDSNGTSTATVLTEGTDWTAAASVATTCASLAAAVEALAGVGATCTSPDVLVTLDQSTAAVTLAESTAGCTTVATGTRGPVVVRDRITNDATYLQLGAAGGTPAVASGANDIYIASGSDTEIDGTLRIDGTLTFPSATVSGGGISFSDNVAAIFGTGSDSSLQHRTANTPDTLILTLGAESNALLICESADAATDFAKTQQTNPTLCVQSADATTTTDRICIAHNQTDAVLSSDGGNINIVPASSITAVTGIIAATGAARDVVTTCRAGEVLIDTGGVTVEICVCTATDTIRCVATATTNPVD